MVVVLEDLPNRFLMRTSLSEDTGSATGKVEKNALVPRAARKAAGGMELGEGRASGWLKTGSLWVVEGK